VFLSDPKFQRNARLPVPEASFTGNHREAKQDVGFLAQAREHARFAPLGDVL